MKRRLARNTEYEGYPRSNISFLVMCCLLIATQGHMLTQAENPVAGETEGGEGGILSALWKFQDLLRNQFEGMGSASSIPDVLLQETVARRMTHRRGLYEHTLHNHFSKFFPFPTTSDSLSTDHGVQRARSPRVKESWIDTSSGCFFFQEDGTAYWTYHWCPKANITQAHLVPVKTDWKGNVMEYKVMAINKLGSFDADAKWNLTAQEDGIKEFYANGDYCDPHDDKRLRRKEKRKAVVIIRPCPHVSEITVIKVLESEPCHYMIHVCDIPQSNDKNESNDTDDLISEDIVSQMEVNETDNLMIMEDIQKAMSAYLKVSGIYHSNMNQPDRTTSLHDALPPLPPSRREQNLKLIRDMFTHAYDSYMYHAYPASEIKPLTCRPGTFELVKLPALTLIDTLDTLVLMKNFTEFARGVERLRDLHKSMQEATHNGKKTHILNGGLFSTNSNVSLFETNIRVLGGLLSAHQLAVAYLSNQVLISHVRNAEGSVLIGPIVTVEKDSVEEKSIAEGTCPKDDSVSKEDVCVVTTIQGHTRGGKQSRDCKNKTESLSGTNDFWIYDGFLLDLAHDLGKRMLPAFQTKTGIPYGTVNLVDGIPNGESQVASLAGAGTLSLEFELLSRLTGDESFGKAAKLASRALWMRRSKKDLLGKHINIERGGWTETLSGIGSNSDSFYEYLLKHYLLFPEDHDFWHMFLTSYYGIYNESRLGEWYVDVDMNVGNNGGVRRVFESLMAFFPGMQVLLGELSAAARTENSFFMVREAVGLLPERFNFGAWKVDGVGAARHPLRPELLESCYFLHKATQGISAKNSGQSGKNSGWLWAADYSLHTINWHTWAPCGYSTVNDVSPLTTGGVPGSQAWNHRPTAVNEMPSFFLSETLKYLYLTFDEDNLLHSDTDRQWIFTTEAHPIHYEATGLSDLSAKKNEQSKHRKILRNLLLKRSTGKKMQLSTSPTKSHHVKTREKWTEKSLEIDFHKQIYESEVENCKHLHQLNQTLWSEVFDSQIIQPIFSHAPENENKSEFFRHDKANLAHLSLASSAAAHKLISKRCVNVYNPNLAWINALNGGITDYASIYVSSTHDEITPDVKYGMGSLSASHALALYGTGLYLGKKTNAKSNVTPITFKKSSKEASSLSLSRRIDMGGDLGEFEITSSKAGNGFHIQQIKTGETIIITILNHEKGLHGNIVESNSPYVMIYAITPSGEKKEIQAPRSSQSWLPDLSWKSVFRRETFDKSNKADVFKGTRRVVFGDASGASFSCKILILTRKFIDLSSPHWVEDKSLQQDIILETEDIVHTIPCAPGLFGPSRLEELIEKNGAGIEGVLLPPDPNNEDGCLAVLPALEPPDENIIRMVKRGSCTFQEKVYNQKLMGANAVIVVNSMNKPSDLFLMAPGLGNGKDLAMSTLISGGDGVELLKKINDHDSCSTIARIVMFPQHMKADANGAFMATNGLSTLNFPILVASSESIQVFASGGWAVNALPRPLETIREGPGAHNDWQLILQGWSPMYSYDSP